MEEEPLLYTSTSPSYQQLVRVSVNPKWCFSDEIEADERQRDSFSKIVYQYASQQSAPTLPSVIMTQGPFERSKDYHDNHQFLQSFLGLNDYQRSIDRINLSNRSMKIEPTTFANFSILLGIVVFLLILIPGIFDLRRYTEEAPKGEKRFPWLLVLSFVFFLLYLLVLRFYRRYLTRTYIGNIQKTIFELNSHPLFFEKGLEWYFEMDIKAAKERKQSRSSSSHSSAFTLSWRSEDLSTPKNFLLELRLQPTTAVSVLSTN